MEKSFGFVSYSATAALKPFVLYLFTYLYDMGFMESMNEKNRTFICAFSTSTHSSASAPMCVCVHSLVCVPVCTWLLTAASVMFS